jgi:hypothetical protein
MLVLLALPVYGAASVPTCAKGTIASYLGTSCLQVTTVYHWNSYSCTSNPPSICAKLETNGSNVNIMMDPNGANTLLWQARGLWNVSAGQSVDIVIRGTVYGASANGNWPHYKSANGSGVGWVGQTGDGSVETITTVACGDHCKGGKHGESDVLCSATGPKEYCNETDRMIPYFPEGALFAPAPADDPYPLTIEIKLNGGKSGTASLWSLGTHLAVVKLTKAGMSFAEVEKAIGSPQSKVDLGEKVLYKYKDMTVEFQDGKVTGVH